MASSAATKTESREQRSSPEDRNNSRSKSPVQTVPHIVPIRPSVSLGSPLGHHHPSGMSPMPGIAPHPAPLNGLRPPWLGIPGGYPLPFHPGALAHPYLLAAAAPHVNSPMGNMAQSSLRAHHDLLKMQAASLQMNGKIYTFFQNEFSFLMSCC